MDKILIDRAVLERVLHAIEYSSACISKQLTTQTKHDYALGLLAEANDTLRTSLEQVQKEQNQETYNGWVLRDVLFDNGEPVGHRAPPPRKPLTRQQIQQLVIAVCDKIYPQDGESYSEADSVFYGALAHIIEQSHGIGNDFISKPRMCPSTYYECSRGCGDETCKDFADAHRIGK